MHVDLPGGYAELLDLSALTVDHQDEYFDLGTDLREKKAADQAETADESGVRLNRKEVRPIQDLVMGWLVQEISFPGVLPWGAKSRTLMPLWAWNVLSEAVEPYYDILNGGEGPKADPNGTGSEATSPASTLSLPPEPPGA